MSHELADGYYTVKAVGTASLLMDANGALSVVATWGEPTDRQTWQLANCDDGTITLRCVGSQKYLSLASKEGLYYAAAGEPERWKIRPSLNSGGYDIVRVSSERLLWLCGFPLSPQPVWQQGIDPGTDILPARWEITPVERTVGVR